MAYFYLSLPFIIPKYIVYFKYNKFLSINRVHL